MALDSDVQNGDSQLHVTFYEHERAPYKGVPFVRIMVPGDKNNIVDQPVRESHKERFARQWLYFLSKNAVDQPMAGTPLKAWHDQCPEELTDGQLMELEILKFQTVEQLRTASDAQIQRIGMGGPGLRERARIYLARKNQSETTSELAETKGKLAALEAQMAQLMATKPEPIVISTPEVTLQPIKRGPGRPKRDLNVQHNHAPVGAAGNK